MFVYGGYDAVRNPDATALRAARITDPLSEFVSIDADPAGLVRLNGAVQIGAGLALATGKMTRTAATLLAGSLILTTMAGHRFWEEADRKVRAQQSIQFVKNLSMLGGLLAVAAGG
jgi:uncharacterized membrane protein YphA (DoxX/SURF4 family)